MFGGDSKCQSGAGLHTEEQLRSLLKIGVWELRFNGLGWSLRIRIFNRQPKWFNVELGCPQNQKAEWVLSTALCSGLESWLYAKSLLRLGPLTFSQDSIRGGIWTVIRWFKVIYIHRNRDKRPNNNTSWAEYLFEVSNCSFRSFPGLTAIIVVLITKC